MCEAPHPVARECVLCLALGMGVRPLAYSKHSPLLRAQLPNQRSSRAARLELALTLPQEDWPSRDVPLKPLPRVLENVADDPRLHNPLQRLERLGSGWLGVIVDYEGTVVESTADIHRNTWLALAEEEGKPRPLERHLDLACVMKAEQAITELLCWGRDPGYVRRLVERRNLIYKEFIGEDWMPSELDGARNLLEILNKHKVPVAVCSTNERDMMECMRALEMDHLVCDVVSSGDVQYCRPDPEAYTYAAMLIGRPPARCVVIGSCNPTIEAAHQVGMQCVAVAGGEPLYQLGTADLVVKELSEISFVNLKQLFRLEEGVEPQYELEQNE